MECLVSSWMGDPRIGAGRLELSGLIRGTISCNNGDEVFEPRWGILHSKRKKGGNSVVVTGI